MKKSLTQDEYLQLLGLLTLAQLWQRRLDDVRDAVTVLMEAGDDVHGHVSDAIYGEVDITTFLSRLDIDVPDIHKKVTA